MSAEMQVLYNGQSMRDALVDVFKRLPNNGDLLIKTVTGDRYVAFEPITIFWTSYAFRIALVRPTSGR
jgi:hypothetical protein